MRAINAVCNELREGGGRRSALMFCLRYDHPDLMEFLEAKLDKKELNNANVSVCIDDTFLKLLDEKGEVVFKWQGEERGRMAVQDIWDKIVKNAWESGDPGVLNIGLANMMNTISYQHDLVSTNPCGEIWMPPYDCCCLGAVNLHTHVINGEIDWDLLEETVAMSVRFLDDVLDQNNYPLPIIQETCQKYRRIGLGVMGLHDMLLELGLKYSSRTARDVVDEVMSFVKKQAYHASIALAIEKGSFHAFDVDQHTKTGFAKKCLTRRHHRLIKEHGIRNCAILTIAPTGTISIVAGCSSGIEPLFQPIYERRFNQHQNMHNNGERDKAVEVIVHPLLKKFLDDRRSTKHFQGAHDIPPEAHLAMQAVCQKHIDNSISKTINLSIDYSVEQLSIDMKKYISELKGITIYRDGSKGESPLVPLPLSEARKYLERMEEQAAVDDCPSGACDVKKGSE
jgi:ribonucleoside-diphosphate reductase alpha chain